VAETLLALRDVSVRHGASTVLQLSSLDVHAGEILAIIGPNGSGKSTLLRVIGLLQQPATGKVYFAGEEATRTNALLLRRRMASIFQQPLLVNASVYDNAALGLKMRGLRGGEIKTRLRPWLERLGIAHLASRRARTLSGGEAQRTSLARALALNPELLLLDEPFSALDPQTREALLADLQRILGETAVTAVLVTHDRNEAFMLGKRIGVLKAGRMLQLGSSLDVFTRPVSEAVAEIIGIDNRFAGTVKEATDGVAAISFDGGVTHVFGRFAPGVHVILCIRPEDIALSRPDERRPRLTRWNEFQTKVAGISPWMLQYRVRLECGKTFLVAFIDRSSFLELGILEGDEVIASFSPKAVHAIESRSATPATH
jgi:tungstate transport system ATP-binding protein